MIDSGLDRVLLRHHGSHLEQFPAQGFAAFLFHQLGLLPGFFLVFVHAEVELDVEAGEHGGAVSVADIDLELPCDAFSEVLAELDEVQLLELDSRIGLLLGVAPAGALDGVGVVQVVVSEYSQSGAVLLVLLIAEFAAVQVEVGTDLVQQLRKVLNLGHRLFLWSMWRINEDVSLPRMGMHVQEHLEFAPLLGHLLREVLLHECPDEFHFVEPHFGFGVVVRKEASVHVLALRVAPVVAGNDSVWVDLGQDPELKVLSELMRKHISGEQEVEEPMNNKATVGFAGVLSTKDHHCRLGRVFLFVLVGYFEALNIQTAERLSDGVHFEELKGTCFCDIFDLSDVRLKLSVGIRNSISHIYLILLIIKFVIETHHIV